MTILNNIVKDKRNEVALQKEQISIKQLEKSSFSVHLDKRGQNVRNVVKNLNYSSKILACPSKYLPITF